MMGLGTSLLELVAPLLERMGPAMPGETFPAYFEIGMFQRALLAAILVTIVAGLFGTYLMLRNLALIGDGLAHVSFGGVAIGIVLGAASPLWYALLFSIASAIIIHVLQTREILTGDTSIAIFLTGMLALGLVVLRVWGDGITSDIEGYLWGSLNIIDSDSLDLIALICLLAIVSLAFLHRGLLAVTIDRLAAQVQGLPVRFIGLWFSITVAAIVVSMVQVVGTLLVTALLVTPAATAQLVSRSFRGCIIWTQFFGISATVLGIYFSAEMVTGSGAMIALVAAIQFILVGIVATTITRISHYAERSRSMDMEKAIT